MALHPFDCPQVRFPHPLNRSGPRLEGRFHMTLKLRSFAYIPNYRSSTGYKYLRFYNSTLTGSILTSSSYFYLFTFFMGEMVFCFHRHHSRHIIVVFYRLLNIFIVRSCIFACKQMKNSLTSPLYPSLHLSACSFS